MPQACYFFLHLPQYLQHLRLLVLSLLDSLSVVRRLELALIRGVVGLPSRFTSWLAEILGMLRSMTGGAVDHLRVLHVLFQLQGGLQLGELECHVASLQ